LATLSTSDTKSLSIEWKLNQAAFAEASRTDGIFPLIADTEFEACEVLRKYKNQSYLENRMYAQKTILEVTPIFIKKEHRIEAMLFLYFIALMIVSLIERKIRINMAGGPGNLLPGLRSNKRCQVSLSNRLHTNLLIYIFCISRCLNKGVIFLQTATMVLQKVLSS
jgi:transposase